MADDAELRGLRMPKEQLFRGHCLDTQGILRPITGQCSGTKQGEGGGQTAACYPPSLHSGPKF